jgi:hypothetical protein
VASEASAKVFLSLVGDWESFHNKKQETQRYFASKSLNLIPTFPRHRRPPATKLSHHHHRPSSPPPSHLALFRLLLPSHDGTGGRFCKHTTLGTSSSSSSSFRWNPNVVQKPYGTFRSFEWNAVSMFLVNRHRQYFSFYPSALYCPRERGEQKGLLLHTPYFKSRMAS